MKKGPTKGFQAIKKFQVSKLKGRGNKTKGGKIIKDPEAYVAAGLRKTGIKKYGKRGFAQRQKHGRRRFLA
jgi:hypothetical protein